MKSALAVLTYKRVNALKTCLDGLSRYCSHYPTAIFEDCGQTDETEDLLRQGRSRVETQFSKTIISEQWTTPNDLAAPAVFLGTQNLGVAGNSNRALFWFNTFFKDYDHLCILNDDLTILGDFVKLYAEGHDDLDVGHFNFCDFTGDTYRWVHQRITGKSGKVYMVKILPRFTGIMMSMTRKCINAIGYFDPRFGKFGEEHCVSPSTPMICKNKLVEIKDAVNTPIEIWNGKHWATVVPMKTRSKQKLIRVHFGDGSYLDCTEDHRFSAFRKLPKNGLQIVRAKDLTRNHRCERTTVSPEAGISYPSAYTLGFALGDGYTISSQKTVIDLIGKKEKCPVQGIRQSKIEYAPGKFKLPVDCSDVISTELVNKLKKDPQTLKMLFNWNRESALNFIAGLADADGNEIKKTGAIRIAVSHETRAQLIQLLLTKNGIISSITLISKKGTLTNFGPRTSDLYVILICNCEDIPCHRLNTSRGHLPKFKGKFQTIRKIEQLPGLHDVYCFTEPDQHKGLFSNVLTFQCDYTIRARQAGFIALNGSPQNCLDLKHDLLEHQEIETSLTGPEREAADAQASLIMRQVASEYPLRHHYRPLIFNTTRFASGRDGVGLPVDLLQGYRNA